MIKRIHVFVATCLLSSSAAFASEIREFDVKTLQRLGNELTRVSQTPDRGATTPERKRAKQTAIAALQGKLFPIHYEYVVLDDPGGSGFLVYALGSTGKPTEAVVAGHVRVSVSAAGEKVERIDPLSHTLMIADRFKSDLPKGYHKVGQYMNQIVSDKPVETLIYSASVLRQPIVVGTPDGKVWLVENGKISIDRSKPGSDTIGAAGRKGLGR
jgi:hypothetical protein